jgi:hypothetical protein
MEIWNDMAKVGGENGSRRDVAQPVCLMSDFAWVGQRPIALFVTSKVD